MNMVGTSSAPAPASEDEGESTGWMGIWYDGLSTRPHRIRVGMARDHLLLLPEEAALAEPRRYTLAGLACPEPWQGAAPVLALPDGSSLMVDADTATSFHRALHAAGLRPAWVSRLIGSWMWAVFALLMVLALVVGLDRKGIPWAAEVVVTNLPPGVEKKIAQPFFAYADKTLLAPSKVPEEKRERLRQRFAQAANALAPERELALEFRSLQSGSQVNAFAIPGHVVLLDDLVTLMNDDEILGVLGHELGHLVHGHGMEGLLRASGLAILGAAVLGDVSMIGTGALVMARSQQHSREAEREADAFALRLVDAAGASRHALVSGMEKFEALEKGAPLPPEWLLSHPDTASRRAYFESEAAAPAPK